MIAKDQPGLEYLSIVEPRHVGGGLPPSYGPVFGPKPDWENVDDREYYSANWHPAWASVGTLGFAKRGKVWWWVRTTAIRKGWN